MGFFGPDEKLNDPIAFSVTSGATTPYPLGKVSAFRVVRGSTSAGKVGFLARQETSSESAAAGYELSSDAPDSGWIFADATTHLLIAAVGGNVAGQIWTMSRL